MEIDFVETMLKWTRWWNRRSMIRSMTSLFNKLPVFLKHLE